MPGDGRRSGRHRRWRGRLPRQPTCWGSARTTFRRLVCKVIDREAGMACGLSDRGRLLDPVFLRLLPKLTGERAILRELFESLHPKEIAGYKVEAALKARAAKLGLQVASFVCDGMWRRTKGEKFYPPAGLAEAHCDAAERGFLLHCLLDHPPLAPRMASPLSATPSMEQPSHEPSCFWAVRVWNDWRDRAWVGRAGAWPGRRQLLPCPARPDPV